MNKIKFFSLFSIAALTLLIVSGCNKHDEITSPKNIDLNSPAFMIVDYTDVSNAIEDATIETPMQMNTSLVSYSFLNLMDGRPGNNQMIMPMLGGGRWLQLFDWGKDVGVFFGRLQLTDDQKSKIKDLVTAYHESIKPLVKEFAGANQSIIDDANVKRKAIADDVKAGKLTRLQAAEKIKALNEATRTAIENNPVSKTIKQKMCDLRSGLFAKIGQLLTADQLTKWNNAISKMKNPCQ